MGLSVLGLSAVAFVVVSVVAILLIDSVLTVWSHARIDMRLDCYVTDYQMFGYHLLGSFIMRRARNFNNFELVGMVIWLIRIIHLILILGDWVAIFSILLIIIHFLFLLILCQ